jgi:hypothetical protein
VTDVIERDGHRPSPRAGILARTAVATLLVALTGCSGGSGDGADAGCAAPSPAPAAETALMPAKLSFDKVGTVTHVQRSDGNLTVRAVSSKPLDEVTVLIQDAVTAAGYRPAGMDTESDEAEVFFNSGSVAAGQATVREADCEGRWNIELVLIAPGTAP